ncbi:MAG: hypothetical protein ACRC2T_01365 [Thermoguttaceae bacterium]
MLFLSQSRKQCRHKTHQKGYKQLGQLDDIKQISWVFWLCMFDLGSHVPIFGLGTVSPSRSLRRQRHTFISNLCRAGVASKTEQLHAKHSTIELTMQIYTRRSGGANRRDSFIAGFTVVEMKLC